MEDYRNKLAKNIVSLNPLTNVTELQDNQFRGDNTYIFCPHCLQNIEKRTFTQNEVYTCHNCSMQARFIVWSRLPNNNYGWKASLTPIN